MLHLAATLLLHSIMLSSPGARANVGRPRIGWSEDNRVGQGRILLEAAFVLGAFSRADANIWRKSGCATQSFLLAWCSGERGTPAHWSKERKIVLRAKLLR